LTEKCQILAMAYITFYQFLSWFFKPKWFSTDKWEVVLFNLCWLFRSKPQEDLILKLVEI